MSLHPSPDQIFRFLGSQTALENRGVARHLLQCGACRSVALGALRGDQDAGPAAKVLNHPSAGGGFAAVQGDGAPFWREKLRQAVREVERSRQLIAELKNHPRDRWCLVVPNSRRFHNLVVAQFVVEESRIAAFDDPRLAVDLAQMALGILDRLDPEIYGERLLADIRGRTWSAVGRARRMSGDLAGAEEAFKRAGRLLADSADPVEVGSYLHLLAGLRKDQRRFDEAGEHLRQAAAHFRDAGDDVKAVRALVGMGSLRLDEGMPSEALPLLLEALEGVDEAADPLTVLAARHNLAVCLAELEEWQEARRVFRRLSADYAVNADSHLRIHGRWLEGIIAAGHREDDRAEALFREVRETFAANEQTYDAALVALDLAMLLARQGRNAELRTLAKETAAAFLAQDVHREAAAAVGFFRQAVARDRATAELVGGIARYLKRARTRPGLPFASAG